MLFTSALKALQGPLWPFHIQLFVLQNQLLSVCLCSAIKDCDEVKAEALTLKN